MERWGARAIWKNGFLQIEPQKCISISPGYYVFSFERKLLIAFLSDFLAICIPFMKKNDSSVFSIPLNHLFLVDCLLTSAR